MIGFIPNLTASPIFTCIFSIIPGADGTLSDPLIFHLEPSPNLSGPCNFWYLKKRFESIDYIIISLYLPHSKHVCILYMGSDIHLQIIYLGCPSQSNNKSFSQHLNVNTTETVKVWQSLRVIYRGSEIRILMQAYGFYLIKIL